MLGGTHSMMIVGPGIMERPGMMEDVRHWPLADMGVWMQGALHDEPASEPVDM